MGERKPPLLLRSVLVLALSGWEMAFNKGTVGVWGQWHKRSGFGVLFVKIGKTTRPETWRKKEEEVPWSWWTRSREGKIKFLVVTHLPVTANDRCACA
jgi:hypothetical protein